MRVLSVIETLGHGGAETVLVDLVTGLTAHDHRVVHFSSANGALVHPWIADALSHRSIPVLDVDWRTLESADGRRAFLTGFAPDVVLYHWWGGDLFRAWLLDLQPLTPPQRPGFVIALHRSGMSAPPGFDAYVLVTPSQRPQVAAIDPERVHVIPNGIDVARFRPRTTLPFDRPLDRPFTVGRVSNLRDGKIPPDWVRTAAAYDLPGARFVIAGDGPLRAALEEDVRALRLESTCSLPGYVPREDVPDLLATFDVFCYVTSTAVECHPLALLEACAAGLPIVAEARGGVPDIVSHGVNGLLARSSDEVGAHLRTLQHDAALRARLSAGARETASRLSLEGQRARYADLLSAAARSVASTRVG